MNCPIEIYIEHHKFKVIASDGSDIQDNLFAEILVVSGGERYVKLLQKIGQLAKIKSVVFY